MNTHPPLLAALEEPGPDLDGLARIVIGAALEVHRWFGPGFAEGVYEEALAVELGIRGIRFERQTPMRLGYKGYVVGQGRLDLVVDGRLIVEVKAVESLPMLHAAQVLAYLRATGCRLGLLINFNVPVLRLGIKRVVLTNSSRSPGLPPRLQRRITNGLKNPYPAKSEARWRNASLDSGASDRCR